MAGRVLSFDAVVVGAGTAGANAAWQLARRGRRVALLERRGAGRGGAHWHNGVLDRQFHEAGVPPPSGAERVAEGGTMRVFGPDRSAGPVVADAPVVRADMALLGERLRRLAADAGAELFDRVEGPAVDWVGGRLVAINVSLGGGGADGGDGGDPTRGGATVRLEAPLFVDASGRRGVLRRSAGPELSRWWPPVRGPELCSATDVELRVSDRDGARRFLDRHSARPGDAVSALGLQGGFSTEGVTVHEGLDTLHVLVGCLADGRHSTGPAMLAELRRREPWIGEQISGGSGVIPLRRPYARTAAPGLALVGDAACQVFPAHGSGIGIGLIAGTMLADAVADAADPGAEPALWVYQRDFQRRHGGSLAAFDGFRRMSTAVGSGGVVEMVRHGVLSEEMVRSGLDQRWETPPAGELPATAARLGRSPRLAGELVPRLARSQLAGRMVARFPDEPDDRALARWDRSVARLLGPPP